MRLWSRSNPKQQVPPLGMWQICLTGLHPFGAWTSVYEFSRPLGPLFTPHALLHSLTSRASGRNTGYSARLLPKQHWWGVPCATARCPKGCTPPGGVAAQAEPAKFPFEGANIRCGACGARGCAVATPTPNPTPRFEKRRGLDLLPPKVGGCPPPKQ